MTSKARVAEWSADQQLMRAGTLAELLRKLVRWVANGIVNFPDVTDEGDWPGASPDRS